MFIGNAGEIQSRGGENIQERNELPVFAHAPYPIRLYLLILGRCIDFQDCYPFLLPVQGLCLK